MSRNIMAQAAEEKGYGCNDCFLSRQNCNDRSICCEDETGLCDYFEEMAAEDEKDRLAKEVWQEEMEQAAQCRIHRHPNHYICDGCNLITACGAIAAE